MAGWLDEVYRGVQMSKWSDVYRPRHRDLFLGVCFRVLFSL
jgi:hypothetical protein